MNPRILRHGMAILTLLAIAACTPPKDSAFFNRAEPESLLDASSEVVNLPVATASNLLDLSHWVNKDRPTRAELYCQAGEKHCNDAKKLLTLKGIPTVVLPSNDGSVALVYERILARDCDQRFVDDTGNEYNTPHPAFGCSVAANIVQHVADKRQFVNPSLSEDPSAVGAVDAYRRAYEPNTLAKKEYTVGDSLASKAKASGN